MAYAQKVVLHLRSFTRPNLDDLIEAFIRDGVKYIGVVGVDAAVVEDVIDEIVVGDGSSPSRFILTASHPDESVEEAVTFARSLSEEYAGDVQVIEA
jgi:hypothetical protein